MSKLTGGKCNFDRTQSTRAIRQMHETLCIYWAGKNHIYFTYYTERHHYFATWA